MCDGEHAQFRKPNWLRLGFTSHRRCGFQHRVEIGVAWNVRAPRSVPHCFESFELARKGVRWRVSRRTDEDCGTTSQSCVFVASANSGVAQSDVRPRCRKKAKDGGRTAVNESSTRIYLQVTTAFVRIPIADIRTQSALKVSAAPIRTIPSAGSQRLRALFFAFSAVLTKCICTTMVSE
jgi:hypothetical protein